jgi:hypothetical protein
MRRVSAVVTAGLAGSGLVLSGAGAAPAAAVTGLTCTTGANSFKICSQAVAWTEGLPAAQVLATFSPSTLDASPQSAQFSVGIFWGNGSGTAGTVVANPDGSFSVTGTATFAEEGCCESVSQIGITVQDHGQGNATLGTQDAPVIADAALTAAGAPVSAVPGTAFAGTVATFTDADPGGTASDYTATIDWGDGVPQDQGTVSAQGGGFAVSGSHTYATGGHTITIQVTDTGGSTATATTISSDTDLAIAQPASITATATSAAGAVVSYAPPAVTDEDTATVAPACTPAAGSTFPVGATTVTCTATDPDDTNSPAATSFTVTVADHDLAIAQPADITTTATSAAGAVVSYAPPAATDEDTAAVAPACTPAPGSTFPVGATTVICTATDSSDSNSPATTSFTVTVVPACDLTITAANPMLGPLRVASGQRVCITSGGTVAGPVTVSAGGILQVSPGSTIGPLRSSGAASISVCGSHINGDVNVTFTTGTVILGNGGDDFPFCMANRISGPVFLARNAGAIELGGNIISGPVFLVNNTGHGDLDELGAGPEVEANLIGGPLTCSGNTLAPIDDLQPNSVAGPATGQCAGLAR